MPNLLSALQYHRTLMQWFSPYGLRASLHVAVSSPQFDNIPPLSQKLTKSYHFFSHPELHAIIVALDFQQGEEDINWHLKYSVHSVVTIYVALLEVILLEIYEISYMYICIFTVTRFTTQIHNWSNIQDLPNSEFWIFGTSALMGLYRVDLNSQGCWGGDLAL